MAGQRPGDTGRVGDSQPRDEAEAGEARAQVGQQPRLAAEQVRAAGDVEEQPIGAARLVPGRDQRRVAQAP